MSFGLYWAVVAELKTVKSDVNEIFIEEKMLTFVVGENNHESFNQRISEMLIHGISIIWINIVDIDCLVFLGVKWVTTFSCVWSCIRGIQHSRSWLLENSDSSFTVRSGSSTMILQYWRLWWVINYLVAALRLLRYTAFNSLSLRLRFFALFNICRRLFIHHIINRFSYVIKLFRCEVQL